MIPIVVVFVLAVYVVVIRPQSILVLFAVTVLVVGGVFRLVVIRDLPVGFGLGVDGCGKAGIHQPVFTRLLVFGVRVTFGVGVSIGLHVVG